MKEEDFRALVVLGVVALMWFSAVIVIFIIKANRFLFWMDVLLLILSIPIIIFLVYLAFKAHYDYFGSSDFEGGVELGIAIFVFILFLLAAFNIDNHYDKGYSDEALNVLIQKTQEKEDLELIFNTIASKGENLKQFVIDETIGVLCENSLISCDQKQEYSEKLIELRGYKNQADVIADFLGII